MPEKLNLTGFVYGVEFMKKCVAVMAAVMLIMVYCSTALGEIYALSREDNRYYRFKDYKRFISNYEYNYKEKSIGMVMDNYNTVLDALKVSHPEVKTCFYYVESSRTLDLGITYDKEKKTFTASSDFAPVSPSYEIIKEKLHVDECAHLQIDSIDDVMNYFFSTDHHWNYRGLHRGYTDVVRLMLGEDEKLLEPKEEYVFPFVFNGSIAKTLNVKLSDENFTVYLYDLPECTSFVNDRKRAMDNSENYMNGKYRTDIFTDHYSQYYGGGYGSVRIENPDAPHGTLLVIGTSYARPLKRLLANHYKTVVVVEPKHYFDDLGKNLKLSELVEQYGVEQILFMCDITLVNAPQYPIWK